MDLVPPVPLGASGDEKSLPVSFTGDPAGSMPADIHLFQVFLECASPCVLQPPSPLFLLPSSGTQYVAVWEGFLSLLQWLLCLNFDKYTMQSEVCWFLLLCHKFPTSIICIHCMAICIILLGCIITCNDHQYYSQLKVSGINR